ncbi:MAG: biotin--[acetyl-CoA-carboxylase] ligase [Pseudomonadota bacterium]
MTEALGGRWPVTVLASVGSTNEAAKGAARTLPIQPQWIRAEEQTAGRGRQGRSWASPQGNLYATALFPLEGGYGDALQVPFIAALTVAETVERLAPGSEPKLKWPNDVRVEGQKLSGILIESGVTDGAFWVVAGIGMNISAIPEAVDQAATSIAALRGDTLIDAAMAMDLLASGFASHMQRLPGGFEPVRQAWLQRAEGLGETIRVRSGPGDSYQSGAFEDMGPDGSLILRLPDGARQTIRAGDVELVRQA